MFFTNVNCFLHNDKYILHLRLFLVRQLVRQLSLKKQKEYDEMITNLPKFESNFELLHKKFYNV